jgi:hypothetical protein
MVKLAKDSGRYYLILGNGNYQDVTEQIEKEVKSRVEIEKRLLEYNTEVDSQIHFRLAGVSSQLLTAKNLLADLTHKAEAVVDAWAKTGNTHGPMLALKQYLFLTAKWLEDSKKEDK